MSSTVRAHPARRLDVSSLGLSGSLSCPQDPVYASWPPPPPPLPKPCTQGPDSRRGCPHLQWYWANQTAVSSPAPRPLASPPASPAASPSPAGPGASPPAGSLAEDRSGVLYTASLTGPDAPVGPCAFVQGLVLGISSLATALGTLGRLFCLQDQLLPWYSVPPACIFCPAGPVTAPPSAHAVRLGSFLPGDDVLRGFLKY